MSTLDAIAERIGSDGTAVVVWSEHPSLADFLTHHLTDGPTVLLDVDGRIMLQGTPDDPMPWRETRFQTCYRSAVEALVMVDRVRAFES